MQLGALLERILVEPIVVRFGAVRLAVLGLVGFGGELMVCLGWQMIAINDCLYIHRKERKSAVLVEADKKYFANLACTWV